VADQGQRPARHRQPDLGVRGSGRRDRHHWRPQRTRGVVIDFFHLATFSWDGKVVNFIDESFGDRCPPTTPAPGATARFPGDSGRMFFLNTRTGRLLSSFMKPPRGETGYCSAHLGLPVASSKRLLVNAWYLAAST
jgi:hypothetical protein